MRVMRVVVAPDSFGGTLTAVEAAAAIAAGWRSVAPGDDVVTIPMSDGGPGFIDVLAAGLGGEVIRQTVRGPLGDPVIGRVLVADDTGYVEAADATGLHLLAPDALDPRRTTSYGLGELVAAAAAVSDRVVVGLGGTATNDGGAGLWAALGAQPEDVLAGGGAGLVRLERVLPAGPVPASLVTATDVDNPLLGPDGASAVFGPQKGADRAAVLDLDDALRRWAEVVEAATARPGLRNEPGTGAAGGLGFGLLALGATRTSGFGVVAGAVRLAAHVEGADLVVTGEGSFDRQSLRGKVVSGVAVVAQRAGLPCVVVAGVVHLGRQDAAAAGIDEAVSVAEVVGSAAAARAAGVDGVRQAAARMARRWSGR
jgi:glycerate kinase